MMVRITVKVTTDFIYVLFTMIDDMFNCRFDTILYIDYAIWTIDVLR